MSLNLLLPFLSAAIMAVFVALVFQRFLARRKLHFLYWAIGLAMFGLGSLAEAWLAVAWSPAMFFSWYLFGAALNAAWIGHGTLHLMVRRRWAHAATVVLLLGSLYAAYLMLQVMPRLNTQAFTPTRPVSEQYGTKIVAPDEAASGVETQAAEYRGETVQVIPGLLPLGEAVRRVTPFFNIYGLITLVGGAIYSAFLFWRKRVLPNRVVANVLIAAGALLIAFASTLTRLGYGQYLYVGELLAAILMFAGFQMASRPDVPARAPVPAHSTTR